MEWTDELFEADLWCVLHEHMYSTAESEAQVDKLVRLLGLVPGDAILDAPCGLGRVAIPFARRGFDVTGLDRSKPLLACAKKLAEEASVEVTWIEQDMRDLPDGARFAAVLNLWGSFGYFDDAGNRRFLESAFESLRPGGQLVIDAPTTENIFVPFVARHFGKRGPVWMLQEANYDVLTGLNHGTFTLIHEDGRQATIPHVIRIYSVPEIRALLLDVGFREVRAFSAFGEEPAALGKRPLILATR